jgi:hypothetical protein
VHRTFAALLAVTLALAAPASAIAAVHGQTTTKTRHGRTAAPRASTTPAVTTTPAQTTQSQLTPPSATNPLSPGLPQAAASTPTSTAATLPRVVTSSTSPGNSGLSGSGIAIIAAGAVVLIAAITFFVWRDSRKHAGRRHTTATAKKPQPKPKVPGSQRQVKARKLSPAERKRRKRGRAR